MTLAVDVPTTEVRRQFRNCRVPMIPRVARRAVVVLAQDLTKLHELHIADSSELGCAPHFGDWVCQGAYVAVQAGRPAPSAGLSVYAWRIIAKNKKTGEEAHYIIMSCHTKPKQNQKRVQ